MNSRLGSRLVAALGMLALPYCAAALAAGIFSTTGPVITILNGELFTGEAIGNLDRTGTISIQSRATPALTCFGNFTFGAMLGNAGSMKCTDGTTATFQFEQLGLTRGHGAGVSSRGPLTFTYGLNAAESEAYLKLPPGKALGMAGADVMFVSAKPAPPAVILVSDPAALP